jgi:hypothetical protein
MAPDSGGSKPRIVLSDEAMHVLHDGSFKLSIVKINLDPHVVLRSICGKVVVFVLEAAKLGRYAPRVDVDNPLTGFEFICIRGRDGPGV